MEVFTCVLSPAGFVELSRTRGFIPCELTLRHHRREFRITGGLNRADIERVVGRFPDEPLEDVSSAYSIISLGSTYLSFTFDSNDRLLLVDIEPQ